MPTYLASYSQKNKVIHIALTDGGLWTILYQRKELRWAYQEKTYYGTRRWPLKNSKDWAKTSWVSLRTWHETTRRWRTKKKFAFSEKCATLLYRKEQGTWKKTTSKFGKWVNTHKEALANLYFNFYEWTMGEQMKVTKRVILCLSMSLWFKSTLNNQEMVSKWYKDNNKINPEEDLGFGNELDFSRN